MKTEEFKKILLDAIDKEIEAYTFYTSASERVKEAALKMVFKELAEQETMHRKTLQAYLMGAKTELKFDEAKDYKISDTIENPPLTTDMKPLDGLKLAIKKEGFIFLLIRVKRMYQKKYPGFLHRIRYKCYKCYGLLDCQIGSKFFDQLYLEENIDDS